MLLKEIKEWRKEREAARWKAYIKQVERAERERADQERRRIMREARAEADRIYVIRKDKAVYDPARYRKEENDAGLSDPADSDFRRHLSADRILRDPIAR